MTEKNFSNVSMKGLILTQYHVRNTTLSPENQSPQKLYHKPVQLLSVSRKHYFINTSVNYFTSTPLFKTITLPCGVS